MSIKLNLNVEEVSVLTDADIQSVSGGMIEDLQMGAGTLGCTKRCKETCTGGGCDTGGCAPTSNGCKCDGPAV